MGKETDINRKKMGVDRWKKEKGSFHSSLNSFPTYKKKVFKQPAVAHTTIPALWEAEAGRWLEPRSSTPVQETWQNPVSTKNCKA